MSVRPENGFSLVEVSVALAIIALGILGTLSVVSANRALVESAWAERRLAITTRSLIDEVEMRYLTGDDFSAFDSDAVYSWSADSFRLQNFLDANGFKTSNTNLRITPSTDANIDYVISLTLTARSGRSASVSRNLRTRLY